MDNQAVLPQGTNLRILLHECRCESVLLNDPDAARSLLEAAVRQTGFTPLEAAHHSFPLGGYTLALILAESHLVVHTWPEFNRLALLELSICDFQRENRQRTLLLGKALADLFRPEKSLQEMTGMIPRLSETLSMGRGNYVEIESVRETRRSAYQDLMVVDTRSAGRCLLLNGSLQVSEKDDFYYHEPLVHLPLLSHPRPERVLICGGGDGGAAREVLRHPSVRQCTLVEIDAEVIDLCRTWLSPIHRGSLDDPRVRIVTEDAVRFLEQSDETYDAILLDTTEPDGSYEGVYTEAFLRETFRRLSPGGCLGTHVGSPLHAADPTRELLRRLRGSYPSIHPYLQFVPFYDSLTAFALCNKTEAGLLSDSELRTRMRERGLLNLKVVSPETYPAFFAIPPALREILG